MTTQLKDIYWLAGLLEGEGCFDATNKQTPRIRLNMNDPDTIARAAALLAPARKVEWVAPKQPGRKGQYLVWVTGNKAAAWMMTLYVLMSKRRQARIKTLLEAWRLKNECRAQ